MESDTQTKRKIYSYLFLAFALSSVFYYFIINQGKLHAPGSPPYTLFLMWSPGIAGLLTTFYYQRNLRHMGWGWGKTKYQAWSYGLPVLYGLVAYGLVWITGLGGLPDPAFVEQSSNQITKLFGWSNVAPVSVIAITVLLDGTLGVLFSCISALGEEIGWRGFLVPQLAKVTSYTKTALISGGIWSIYHYPALLFADYNSGAPVWYSLICFTLLILGASFAFAWLRLRSGSLWTGVILHASHNLFIQNIFDRITSDTGSTKYFIGEFGIALALVCAAVAYVFWQKRSELNLNSNLSL
jgi:membrane protease YdiL (CAAX protease family)